MGDLGNLDDLVDSCHQSSVCEPSNPQVSQLASILGCEGLLPPPAPAVPPHAPGRGTKRAAPPTAPSGTPSPRKRPAKAARVAGAPPAVKLEKTDLNADYIDEGGLVSCRRHCHDCSSSSSPSSLPSLSPSSSLPSSSLPSASPSSSSPSSSLMIHHHHHHHHSSSSSPS